MQPEATYVCRVEETRAGKLDTIAVTAVDTTSGALYRVKLSMPGLMPESALMCALSHLLDLMQTDAGVEVFSTGRTQ